MAGGLLLGRLIPDLNDALERIKVDTVSLPIADRAAGDDVPGPGQGPLRPSATSWPTVAPSACRSSSTGWSGPLLMFTLAWVFLADLPELRTG